jgi:hypothetical protein
VERAVMAIAIQCGNRDELEHVNGQVGCSLKEKVRGEQVDNILCPGKTNVDTLYDWFGSGLACAW